MYYVLHDDYYILEKYLLRVNFIIATSTVIDKDLVIQKQPSIIFVVDC